MSVYCRFTVGLVSICSCIEKTANFPVLLVNFMKSSVNSICIFENLFHAFDIDSKGEKKKNRLSRSLAGIVEPV